MSLLGILLAASSLEYRKEIRRLEREIKRVVSEIRSMEKEEKNLIREVELYEEKRELLENYLRVLRNREVSLRVRLSFTERQLEEISKEEENTLNRIKAGLNLLFLLGEVNVWAAIFNPQKAYVMYERTTMTEALISSYENALREIEGFKRDYTWWKERRETLLEEIGENIKKQEEVLSEIEETEKALKERIKRIRSDKRAKERYVKRLKAKKRKLETLLKRLARRGKKVKRGGGKISKLMWPVRGRIVRKFGYYTDARYGVRLVNNGIDISAAYGSDVVAASGGTVVYAGDLEGYGKVVIIEHKGFFTVYANLKSVYVKVGKRVRRGERIGKLAGKPLHFEVRLGSGRKAVDPTLYLR